MENKYIILGLDPGITTGLCALDLEGKIIKKHSSKKMGIDQIISWIEKTGIPIIISCDVKIPPYLVKKISMKLHAKIISPNHDLKIGEKQRLIEEFFPKTKFKDTHQKDSCASAIFAFKKFKSFFRKVDYHLNKIGKPELKGKVVKKIIFGESKNIKDALTEKPERATLQTKKRKRQLEKESVITSLKKELKKTKALFDSLKQKYEKLEIKNKELEKELVSKKTNEQLLELANKRKSTIDSLEKEIFRLKKEIKVISKELENQISINKILKDEDCFLITKLKDLSKKEIASLGKKDFKNILLIENLSNPSKDSLKQLTKLKIKTILYIRGNKDIVKSLKQKGFDIFPSKEIEILQKGGVLFIKKDSLEKIKKSIESIEKIILEYKKQRT